jgi:membrane dipeptidase
MKISTINGFSLAALLLLTGCNLQPAADHDATSSAQNVPAQTTAPAAATASDFSGPMAPTPTPPLAGADAALWARAEKLHREAIVLDTHNDVTSEILDKGFDLGTSGINSNGTLRTHTDIKRMKEGGLDAQFFAIYVAKEFVSKKPEEGGAAARRAMDMIGIVYDQVQKHPDTFEMALTVADVRRIVRNGKIAALMGIEGGHAIEDSLHTLRNFYRLGVRYLGLTHTNSNNWADSEADLLLPTVKHHGGLSDFGKQVVLEMNRLGMMVDVSHVADETFADVMEITRSPIIASHSSARALARHPRNLTDDQLKAIAKNGGVVMVNFYDGFIDSRKSEITLASRDKAEELKAKYPNDPLKVEAEMKRWREAQPNVGRTSVKVLIDHFEHIIKTAGIDHVGIGADLDGIPLDAAPEGVEDVSRLAVITYELLKRGYSDADVRKVLGENLLRVMERCEQTAKQMQNAQPVAAAQK